MRRVKITTIYLKIPIVHVSPLLSCNLHSHDRYKDFLKATRTSLRSLETKTNNSEKGPVAYLEINDSGFNLSNYRYLEMFTKDTNILSLSNLIAELSLRTKWHVTHVARDKD